MTHRQATTEIHVWLDEQVAHDMGCDTYYSVSEVDSDGDEIRCSDGAESLAEAWECGCELADTLGVPAVEYARGTGEVTDRYTPSEQS